jgi:hypothetical protein
MSFTKIKIAPLQAINVGMNQCPSCGEVFSSLAAFDLHRTGEHGVNRRCMTPKEIMALGQTKGAKGQWIIVQNNSRLESVFEASGY